MAIDVLRYTDEAYQVLLAQAKERPKTYEDPNADFGAILQSKGVSNPTQPTGLHARGPIGLTLPSGGRPHLADSQALDFHANLPGMNPTWATDKYLLAWLCHAHLHAYGMARWPQKKKFDHIRQHWFGESARSLRAWNTAGRTWWLAYKAQRAAEQSLGGFTAEEAVQGFARKPELFHRLEDYNLAQNPLIMSEIVRIVLGDMQHASLKGLRHLFKRLNLIAGTKMLDAMPREEVRSLMAALADDIMHTPDFVTKGYLRHRRPPFRILSLGAGVQSSVLALMADRGAYGLAKPDLAIFADTGWEPPEVYTHLDWLQTELSYEIAIVQAGNIRNNILAGKSIDDYPFIGIPAYIRDADGSTKVGGRRCTTWYKINPLMAEVRRRLHIAPGKPAPKTVHCEMWLGISHDETARQKPSRYAWLPYRYPLIERGLTRVQLYDWFQRHYPDRTLPRSSCIGCPYRSNMDWKHLQATDPAAFQEAVFVDRALRESPVVRQGITRNGGQAYLHSTRIPLAEVDFSHARDREIWFQEECEGMCGV